MSRTLLLNKRFSHIRLRTRITAALILLTTLAICGVGYISYRIGRREILRDAEQSVRNLEAQGSRNLDDRLSAYEENTYEILLTQEMTRILSYSAEEAEQYRVRNEGLPAAITQQSILNHYTNHAYLRPLSGYLYSYDRYREELFSADKIEALFREADAALSMAHPICWKRIGVDICFFRKYVDPDLAERGTEIFVVDESLFDFVGDEISYLSGEQVLLTNETGEHICGMDQEGATYVTQTVTPKKKWTITIGYSEDVLLKGLRRIYRAMLLCLAAAVLTGILIACLLSRDLTNNLHCIEDGLQEFEQGHFQHRIRPKRYDEVGLLGLEVNHMAMRVEELIRQVQKEEDTKRQLEIETLQAQINPHFLYNTLGSYKWAAVRSGEMELADSIDALIGLLRFTIKRAGGLVTVGEEIQYIQNYAAVQRMRYGQQFQLECDISEEAADMEIPGFVLQPIVENSLLHGLDMTRDDGLILLTADLRTEEGTRYLVLSVEDNGIGMNEAQKAALLSERSEQEAYRGFSSIGLRIVHRRLLETYGDMYRTEIRSAPGEGCMVALWIPQSGAEETSACGAY